MPSSAARRTGLLTGTFDPVHLGHVAMARAAMSSLGLSEVWFLVNPDPGHKSGVTDLDDRLAMVRLAIAGEADMHLGEVAPHRMAEFERLMGKYPETEFVFIVGADVLPVMNQWEDYRPARERATFAVAHRHGTNTQLDPNLRAQLFELTEHTQASSRTIQRQLAAGLPAGEAGEPAEELDSRVYEYIREHGLYGMRS